MKIYDCFMFYDEDLIVDLRLNILNQYVNEFIIVESRFTHSGEKRKLLFDKRIEFVVERPLRISSTNLKSISPVANLRCGTRLTGTSESAGYLYHGR